MSKRAVYAIPLAGMALTSVGCKGDEPPPPVVDQLIGTFSVDVFYNIPLPYTALATDVYQDGSLICDSTLDGQNLTFDDQLAATMVINTTFANCVDAAGAAATPPGDQSSSYGFATTVVTLNAAYDIDVANEAGTVFDTLNCTLSGTAFDCESTAAPGAQFNFTKL